MAGVDPAANRWAGARFQSAAEGAVRVDLPAGTREVLLRATCGALTREVTLELPPPQHATAAPGPAVLALSFDGDRLVVHLDPPRRRASAPRPAHRRAGRARRDGTVVLDLRRDLYGRQVWLPTARHHLERPAGLASSPDWHARLPVETVGDRHRLRVLPGGDGPGELHLGPPAPTTSSAPTARSSSERRTPSTRGPPIPASGTSRASPAAPPPTRRGRSSRSCADARPSCAWPGGSSTTATGRPRARHRS